MDGCSLRIVSTEPRNRATRNAEKSGPSTVDSGCAPSRPIPIAYSLSESSPAVVNVLLEYFSKNAWSSSARSLFFLDRRSSSFRIFSSCSKDSLIRRLRRMVRMAVIRLTYCAGSRLRASQEPRNDSERRFLSRVKKESNTLGRPGVPSALSPPSRSPEPGLELGPDPPLLLPPPSVIPGRPTPTRRPQIIGLDFAREILMGPDPQKHSTTSHLEASMLLARTFTALSPDAGRISDPRMPFFAFSPPPSFIISVWSRRIAYSLVESGGDDRFLWSVGGFLCGNRDANQRLFQSGAATLS
mmetsp:Transcript_18390/g.38479  ORF Transcript_18390/g.38479 Transcript_18390/m.38479 type:complete len:299 (-) Transcript_18390:3204-4100(-)